MSTVPDFYPVISIPLDAPEGREEAGTKALFWFTDRSTGTPRQGVFKRLRRPTSGGDWAERIAYELARLLGLPAAAYDLAEFDGQPGVASWTFIDQEREDLVLGDEVLAERYEEYPQVTSPGEDRKVRGHTVGRAMAAAADVSPPIGAPSVDWLGDGADVFVGDLMFDTWIANTDRHHRNWGWIEDRATGERRLAPTFDHDASLGHELLDDRRARLLAHQAETPPLDRYARKGRSEFWAAQGRQRRVSPLEAFIEAARTRPRAARGWAKRLRDVADEQVMEVVARVPRARMSAMASDFCRTLLGTTSGPIFAAVDELP